MLHGNSYLFYLLHSRLHNLAQTVVYGYLFTTIYSDVCAGPGKSSSRVNEILSVNTCIVGPLGNFIQGDAQVYLTRARHVRVIIISV